MPIYGYIIAESTSKVNNNFSNYLLFVNMSLTVVCGLYTFTINMYISFHERVHKPVMRRKNPGNHFIKPKIAFNDYLIN